MTLYVRGKTARFLMNAVPWVIGVLVLLWLIWVLVHLGNLGN